VRSGHFDVVHSSLWGANAFTRVAAVGGRRPAIVVSERRVEDFRSARRRRLDRALRHTTDAYIGNSEAVGSFITVAHAVARERVHVVPNGIDTDVFAPLEQPRRDPAGGPRRIGAVGRLAHQKGFDVLITALPTVLDHHDVEVSIVGEGALRRDLEQQARGLPVSFMGRLDSPSEVADFLRSLDLFVMPSRYEGLPNAVLEAVACGIRVVAADAPGMRAALGSAPLVPAEDPHALARAITSALSDADEMPRARIPDFDDVAQAHARVFRLAYDRQANLPAVALTGAR
jgi:glycosyltransferase involved in cell wall biosynthesis